MSRVSSLQPHERRQLPASSSVDVIVAPKRSRSRPPQDGMPMLAAGQPSLRPQSVLEEMMKLNTRLQEQVDALKRELVVLKEELIRKEKEVEHYKQWSALWQAKSDDRKKALLAEIQRNAKHNEEHEVELESLKSFLDTHDYADPSSIANQLTNINELIEQMASDLSFRWELPREKPMLRADEKFKSRMNSVLGESLAYALTNCDIHGDGSTSLLQYAFQAAAVFSLSQLFGIGTHKSKRYHKFIDLEHQIRENEIQPVYGRWRSLTHSYLRASGKDHERSASKEMVGWIIIDMFNAAQLFGIPLALRDYEMIKNELDPSLSEIANKTLKLAAMVTTQTISKDYDLYIPPLGKFDPGLMETPFPLSKPRANDHVRATIALGMTSSGKPGRQQVKSQTQLFRKAMVITDGTLFELMTPPPTKRKRGRDSPSSGSELHQGLSNGASYKRSSPAPPPIARKDYSKGPLPSAAARSAPIRTARAP